jgi:exo-1,4-beta-D-glucosaminidase
LRLVSARWWYGTTFTISTEPKLHWLVLKGINYRAEIWLNGERIVDAWQVVGMYSAFEFNVTEKAKPGSETCSP